jgi:hypothetical protein
VIDDVVERDRHRRIVALDHHAERIADEHDIDAGLVDQRGVARVVGGQARDLLAVRLHLAERGDVDRRTRRIAELELRIHGAPYSAARMTERTPNINGAPTAGS